VPSDVVARGKRECSDVKLQKKTNHVFGEWHKKKQQHRLTMILAFVILLMGYFLFVICKFNEIRDL
jgi:hypothetical protein